MKSFNIKTPLYFSLIISLLLFTVFQSDRIVDISGIQTENLTADAPLFGVHDGTYEEVKKESATGSISGKINWAILVLSLLMILILAQAFDISKLTAKLTGRKTLNSDKVNGFVMLAFVIVGLGFAAWEYIYHGKLILLGNASSQHGANYDSMFVITLVLTTIVFVVTQALMFYFAYKYSYDENRKGLYYSHNNKLEILWTVIPAIVLTILVLRGHKTWKEIMYADKSKAQQIEVFAYQFGWNARYPGKDGVLGKADYKFISGKNQLGIAYLPMVDSLIVELDSLVAREKRTIEALPATLAVYKSDYAKAKSLADFQSMKSLQDQIDMVESGEALDELNESIRRKGKQKERILSLKNNKTQYARYFDNTASDDIITQEICLVVNKAVTFNFRSRDIIHSAYLPHFRVQMNVVPGMPTNFTFVPIKTTAEERKELNNPEFDYYLYCNKICGASHYNMKMKVTVVGSEAEYRTWLANQSPAVQNEMVIPAIQNSDSTLVVPADTTKKLAFN